MRFLSLFSGIEAASVAWAPLGWQAVAFAEIEPFPCAVLAHHYPSVPIPARSTGGGGLGTDFDCDGGLIAAVQAVAPAVTSKWAKGSGGPAGDECQNLIACHAPAVGVDGKNGSITGPITPTLRAHTHGPTPDGPLVMQPYMLAERGRGGALQLEWRQDGTANALLTPSGGRGGMGIGAIAHQVQVRRLTPVECERLQGFPDGYTAIPWRGKPPSQCPDSPRYRALGNSWAVPVAHWIGRRIDAAHHNRQGAA